MCLEILKTVENGSYRQMQKTEVYEWIYFH